jgi:HD superfamily phosphohydrolase
MEKLNADLNGKLTLAIKMFTNKYSRGFFNQLISSQLDIDRLDYLSRDCFFTGVTEGNIGADRLIKMMDVVDNKLVIEEKGIYSIENFLTARRLMYWQVYLHKSSICAETMLIQIINRAKTLLSQGVNIYCVPTLLPFLSTKVDSLLFKSNPEYLSLFAELDDTDIWACIKNWAKTEDKILSTLSQQLLDRKLFKIILSKKPIEQSTIETVKYELASKSNFKPEFYQNLMVSGITTNSAYISGKKQILIKTKNNGLIDIADASDLPTIKALSKIVKKYYLCWAKNVTL